MNIKFASVSDKWFFSMLGSHISFFSGFIRHILCQTVSLSGRLVALVLILFFLFLSLGLCSRGSRSISCLLQMQNSNDGVWTNSIHQKQKLFKKLKRFSDIFFFFFWFFSSSLLLFMSLQTKRNELKRFQWKALKKSSLLLQVENTNGKLERELDSPRPFHDFDAMQLWHDASVNNLHWRWSE